MKAADHFHVPSFPGKRGGALFLLFCFAHHWVRFLILFLIHAVHFRSVVFFTSSIVFVPASCIVMESSMLR